jgi:adenosine deaminase
VSVTQPLYHYDGSMRDLTLLPKAHLHVHLESTFRWATLHEIGVSNNIAVPDGAGDRPIVFADFGKFINHNALVRACLCKPEDFKRLAVEFCADESAQGTRYVELTFTAAAHGERLGRMEMPLEAVLEGLAEGQVKYDIECRVILDHSRRRPIERARNTLYLAKRYAEQGIIGIGMAGDDSFSLSPFTEVIEASVDAGLHLVHHAGEVSGPESIWEAITIGRAERIGHGIRSLEDRKLVDELRQRGIPLEVCPSSNVALGLVPSLSSHPLPLLRKAGLVVTLNTDIPSVICTSLTAEYARLRDTFGYDDTVLADLAMAAIHASFAPLAIKTRMREQIEAWLLQSDA